MLSDSADFVPWRARECIVASLLRIGLRLALKPVLSPEIPIARQRRRIKWLTRLTQPQTAVAIEPTSIAGVPGEWLSAAESDTSAAIVYLHGGGYCVGSAATHRAATMALAQATRLPVFAADYRLAPEYRDPAARDDALAVYRTLAARQPVVLAGDSAGGGLALATALAASKQPLALVLFSPWIELATRRPQTLPGEAALNGRWLAACARHYLGDSAEDSPFDAELRGLPPTLIQAGADELLRDDAERLHSALAAAGVAVRCEIVPKRWHAFQLHAGWLPSADAAIARAAAFIDTARGRPEHPTSRAIASPP